MRRLARARGILALHLGSKVDGRQIHNNGDASAAQRRLCAGAGANFFDYSVSAEGANFFDYGVSAASGRRPGDSAGAGRRSTRPVVRV